MPTAACRCAPRPPHRASHHGWRRCADGGWWQARRLRRGQPAAWRARHRASRPAAFRTECACRPAPRQLPDRDAARSWSRYRRHRARDRRAACRDPRGRGRSRFRRRSGRPRSPLLLITETTSPPVARIASITHSRAIVLAPINPQRFVMPNAFPTLLSFRRSFPARPVARASPRLPAPPCRH